VVEATQGTVETVPFPILVAEPAGGGREGYGLLACALGTVDIDDDDDELLPPQERVWEAEEREDCAVEDFSFRTRVDLEDDDCPAEEEEPPADALLAQPSGMVELFGLLVTGNDG
jgi:hypothetical protein